MFGARHRPPLPSLVSDKPLAFVIGLELGSSFKDSFPRWRNSLKYKCPIRIPGASLTLLTPAELRCGRLMRIISWSSGPRNPLKSRTCLYSSGAPIS
jgi:hypothetical protein